MSALHLIRIPVSPPQLLRFAREHGIVQADDDLGYTLHAWLTALFGELAPKPFRYLDRRHEVLGYANTPASQLLERAQAFASPQAWTALDPSGVLGKPMPTSWRTGQRLHLEVLTCPVARKGDEEKDLYLRALDRTGEQTPTRTEVYRDWFAEQCKDAVELEEVTVLGMSARTRMVRRARNGPNRLRIVERPQALFAANAIVRDGDRFAGLLARGIGRHRAFGYGMVLLSPPR
ncbi:type I-E CRISPR-associated protein Cas6/Cse3/CasE [Caldimonas thermodepolymerans]|uniref:type I-E CRISPR-associated protein Cas6/Cse3/CasE n=1 Tax=Caldimonas thermodepolymerans TaxID=215580 RepID=UPI0022369E71|nr:type I-E CRISPR-associated protein Cas6/Cse3/CasE [Caldimonas thermodepolymerans]UZG43996.1 type I-E CRISPR-associated protein Cas6/Cse3/CasE [Caldimonas thermodepolymerans]